MSRSRRNRASGPERRRVYSGGSGPGLTSAWQRAGCCGAMIAADPARMGRNWADVHEPGCPEPWKALGLAGPPREVYPGAPGIAYEGRLRAVNRRPGSVPARPAHASARRTA